MSNLTLHTKEGETQSLVVLLVSDYLKVDVKIKMSCPDCPKFKQSVTHSLPLLETENGTLIESVSAILRYLARSTSNQTVYNENDNCVGLVDQNLDIVTTELFRSLSVLQRHERKTDDVDKLELASAKANIISSLKNLNTNLADCTLPLNLADFALFGYLGSLLNADVKKSMKGLKNLKGRWDTVSKDERFAQLLRPYTNRLFN
jgi:glutathione S-transferase